MKAHVRYTLNSRVVLERAVPTNSLLYRVDRFRQEANGMPVQEKRLDPYSTEYSYQNAAGVNRLVVTRPRL